MGRHDAGALVIALTIPLTMACGGSSAPPGGTSGQTSAGAGGSSSSGAGGGSCNSGTAGMLTKINGCDPASAMDATGKAAVEIQFGYIGSKFVYVPKCVKVSPCTTVTFRCQGEPCDFLDHPLQGGTGKLDPASPFGLTNTDELKEKSFTLRNKGTFPYVCIAHINAAMVGAVYVQ